MIDIQIHKKLKAAQGNMLLDIDLQISPSSFVALYGKSGAGKTSLLRILAGLLHPDKGKVSIGEEIWLDTSSGHNLPPQKRQVGLVFQDYALFPNMTVAENLSFALRKNQAATIIEELMEMMELNGLQKQKPWQLSGGQQQRVALARALVQKPQLLLLDEPLSALDLEMRHKLQQYLLRVHREYQLTTIMISHDADEIANMADEVVYLAQGKIRQKGSPVEVFRELGQSGSFELKGTIMAIELAGNAYRLRVSLGGQEVELIVGASEGSQLKVGEGVMVSSEVFKPKVRRLK